MVLMPRVVRMTMAPPMIMPIPAVRWRTVILPSGRGTGRWRWAPIGPIHHRWRVVVITRAAVKGGHDTAEINPDVDPRLGLAGDKGRGQAEEHQAGKKVGCFHGFLRGCGIVR